MAFVAATEEDDEGVTAKKLQERQLRSSLAVPDLETLAESGGALDEGVCG